MVLPPILPGEAQAVPLHLTSWRLQARPKGLGLFFCKVPIHWTSVEKPGEVRSSKRECQSTDFDDHPKRSFRYRKDGTGLGLGKGAGACPGIGQGCGSVTCDWMLGEMAMICDWVRWP